MRNQIKSVARGSEFVKQTLCQASQPTSQRRPVGCRHGTLSHSFSMKRDDGRERDREKRINCLSPAYSPAISFQQMQSLMALALASITRPMLIAVELRTAQQQRRTRNIIKQ